MPRARNVPATRKRRKKVLKKAKDISAINLVF
jgi:ribosomal protein L20